MSTLAETPESSTAAGKRSALAERLQKVAAQPAHRPLSFAQHRLWFLDQLEPNSPLYNTAALVRMSGTLDAQKLEESLNKIIARHDALRTRFAWGDEGPVQIIQPKGGLVLKRTDLSSWPENERDSEAKRLAQVEINQPFNLTSEQLVRARLLRLRTDEHLFILNMHHIVSDEWSLKVFFRELGAQYEALVSGEPARVPELSIQYADYASWQRDWIKGEGFAATTPLLERATEEQSTGLRIALGSPASFNRHISWQ